MAQAFLILCHRLGVAMQLVSARPSNLLIGRHVRSLLYTPSSSRGGWSPRYFSAEARGAFRRQAKIDGVTIVSDDKSAKRALKVLRSLKAKPHAWDTEATGLNFGRSSLSPVHTGSVICATCYCGDDVGVSLLFWFCAFICF